MRRLASFVLTLTTMMSGCGVAQPTATPTATLTALPTDAPTAAPTATPTAPPTGTPSARPSPVDDEFNRLVARVAGGPDPAGSELDTLWRSVLAETDAAGQSDYVPPSRLVPYQAGEVPTSSCAAAEPLRFWINNARYCDAEKSILYDESWLREFSSRTGAYAPAAILAHEWGHHAQRLLGVTGYSIQNELQADCMAGLFLANTERVLPDVPPDDDPLAAALKAFFDIGNSEYKASKWFQDGEHGSSQQRIRAFATGAAASFLTPGYAPPIGRGVAMCYGYRDFKVEDFALIGDYRLINLPGRVESLADGAYVIAPELRLGFDTSAIVLDWLGASTPSEVSQKYKSRFPGVTAIEPGPDLSKNVKPGVGSASYVEQASPGLAGGVRSGMLAFVVPATGTGALIVFVYREQSALTDPLDESESKVLAEQIATLYEVLARLCSPDDSKLTTEPNFKPVCLDDQ